MHLEIKAAVGFLVKLLSQKNKLTPDQLESLGENLACLLSDRYQGHWYPDKPSRGQAYRCIRINSWQNMDESLVQACIRCGIEYSKLPLPKELTLWIDPFEVCGRLGEDTQYFTIASFSPRIYGKPLPVFPEDRPGQEPLPISPKPGEELLLISPGYEQQFPFLFENETSDYSTDGNSSDGDTCTEITRLVKAAQVIPPTCPSPVYSSDEAIDSPSITPVNELFPSKQEANDKDVIVEEVVDL